MKKITFFFILTFAGLTVSQAQSTYLSIDNTVTGSTSARFIIPNNPTLDVTAAQSKTITFKAKTPNPVPATANGAPLMRRNDTAGTSATEGMYGIHYSNLTNGTTGNDFRTVATAAGPTIYGSATAATTTLNDGNWHHFALVLNDPSASGATTLYFDGVLMSAATSTNTTAINMSSLKNLVFGNTNGGGTGVKSIAFDDIRIWDHAFTASEVSTDRTAVISASNAPSIATLLAAYDFESATLANVPDITGKTTVIANVNKGTGGGANLTNFVTDSPLSNKNFTANTLIVTVQPNPTTDIVNINAPGATAAIAVQVVDLSGKVVATAKSNDTTATVSLANTAAGVYLVKVTDGKSSYTQKVIKK